MIYDTFLFYNELDLLEIRLNTLWNAVDYFVIAEATLTHQKEKKPLYFDENKQRFKKYEQKIIHLIIDDELGCYGDLAPWKYQRNCIKRGLKQCEAEDRIILSDVDEIPSPEQIFVAKEISQTILFRQQLYYYFVDCRSIELNALPWSIMFRYGDMNSFQEMRDIVIDVQAKILGGVPDGGRKDVLLLDNAGWHFSYLGGVDAIVQKIEAFADAEFNLSKFKNREKIYQSILQGKDIYGRELAFEFVNGTDHLPFYLRENIDKYDAFFRSSLAPPLIFDQYSRYKACSDLLCQTDFVAGNSVLDIGSGPECLFGQFMPDAAMTYVDPLIPDGFGPGHITGNVFASELDGQSFDCVSAVDVLEHVPSEHRQAFLERMASLGKNTLILGFPTSDSSDALATDKAIDDQYRAIFGHDYSWLEEHYRYGLPSLAETVGQLSQLGWHCQTVGHGHAPWLRELLGFVICVWDIPSLSNVVLAISEKFNRELYAYDFRPPYYRQFVIASRSPLPPIIAPVTSNSIEAADYVFRVLMEDAQQQYFIASLRQFVEHDALIASLNQKIEEVSAWGVTQQATVAERDAQIGALNQNIEEVSLWGVTQQATLADRDMQIGALNQKIGEVSLWGATQQATLAERDIQIAVLNQKIEEVSTWGAALQSAVAERDALIASPCQHIEEPPVLAVSQYEKMVSLEQALSDKQAELMKMSDWAHGMMLELNRRNASIASRVEKAAKRGGALARKKLAQSFLGDMVRHVRDSRRFREKRVSLEAIRQSVLDNRGRLIITFPIITWDFRWQRPQHIVSRLRSHGFSVLYVAMSLAALGHRLRGNKEAFTQICFNELAPHVNQIWLNSSKQLNIYTDPIEGDDLHNISIGLNALISELRPKSIIYLVQFPGWGPVAQALQKKLGGKVVFDCMDDHGGFSTNTSQALKTEEMLIKNADLVITSSNLLEGKSKVLNRNTIQVKNGTEFDHFAAPIQNGSLNHFCDRPIIGYYGAISDWFDMKLVAHCATQRPDWNFVLIGATFGADLQPVAGLENVHFLGEKPYKDLPGYLAYFDVCTIPFKVIPLTLATNPVKFYEYLSSGKPVVSIELPELLAYQEDCYLARNPDAFLAQLERAYNERKDEKLIGRRLKLASENSWDARVSAILEAEIFKTHLHQN